MNRKLIAAVVAGLVTFGFTSVARATTDDVVFDFDSSDPAVDITAPASITSGSHTIDVTTNYGIYVSGDANNGDPGGWSLIAPSSPNLMKIWDNADIAISDTSYGWSVSCSTGNMASNVTVTITSYFEGSVVETVSSALGTLNNWETLTSTSDAEVDRIDIVGRDSSDLTSTAPFGCDDLTLHYAPEATTTTTTEVSTTQAPTDDTLVKTGTDGSRGAQTALLLIALGATAFVVTRRRTHA